MVEQHLSRKRIVKRRPIGATPHQARTTRGIVRHRRPEHHPMVVAVDAPTRQRNVPALGGFFAAGLCALALVFALGAGLYWLYRGPALRVDTVEVQGATIVDPAAIAGAAGLDGKSLLTAKLNEAAERVAVLPLVASVQIERKWPRTVRVIISERQPWGTWEQDGVRYTIDREGVVMGTNIAPPPDSPTVRSSQLGTRLQGERVDPQAVDAAAEIFSEGPAALGVEVTEVAFLAGKGVQVRTADGQSALLGDSSGIAYKLAAWAAMAREAKRRGIHYTAVDLRSGDRPVLVQ